MERDSVAPFAAILAVAAIAFGWVLLHRGLVVKTDGLPIAASFYPLGQFAGQVGGARVAVSTITPAGSEPHDYEPTPRDIINVRSSKLFVLNGNGLDGWADKIKNDIARQGATVVRIADSVDSIESVEQEKMLDPHFWLDPVLAQKEVALIRDALITIDPSGTAHYQANTDDYIKKLQQLDQEYIAGLAHCTATDIVTSHAAFGYVAKRYHLTQIAIAGFSPDEEPSPKRLAEIADLVKQKHIKYIFFETLVNPKLAQTVASETGAQTAVFNPLEGLTDDEVKAGKNYLSVMRDNLASLRQALNCQ